MGRPRKTLEQLVRDGTFLARRAEDRQLLLGAPLRWPNFANLQIRYTGSTGEAERRAVALEFERLVRAAQVETQRRLAGGSASGAEALAAELATLGRAGSLKQLLAFFPGMLAHSRGPLIGQPFKLASFQKNYLREFYRRDRKGRRVYRNGILGISRGCGKTPLAAALGLHELITRRDAPEIICAAGSKEQAGIALGFARSFVEDGPLSEWVQLKNGLFCPATRGTMQVISSEGRLQHGRMPAVALIDELWAFETKRQRETYTALASALHKRTDSYLLVITTAGYDKHSLLGEIHDAALAWPQVEVLNDGYLTVAKDVPNGLLLHWYGAPDGATIDDPAVWRKANPAGWIPVRELKRQLADPGLDENEFRRLNLNQWTTTKNAWLPAGVWAGLRSDQTIPDRGRIYVGVDIGLYHDSTAVVWAHPLDDGRILLRSRVWSADPNSPADVHVRNKIELEEIEQFILRLASELRIVELAYDPHFFQRSAELLAKRGITTVEFIQSSSPMRDAYQAFYQHALEGKLTHNGNPILAQHIDATAATRTERGWKLHKLKNTSRIDATIASVLAVTRARHHKPSKPNIHWFDPGA